MRTGAALCLLCWLVPPSPAFADPPTPKTAVSFVLSDEPMNRATRATLELTFDKALKQDDRIQVLDEDLQLAERAGEIPGDVAAEARGLLATGEALVKKGRANDALARLIPAESQLERLLPYVKKRELARTQFLIGVAHAMNGKRDDARSAFVRLMTWRSGFELDTSLEPGKVIPIWDEAKKLVERLPTSTIRIRSEPDAALAYVDGEFAGFTPTSKKQLIVGTHYVTVRAQGHQRQVQRVAVEPDRNSFVRVELGRSPHADELASALAQVQRQLGDASIEVPAKTLHELLGADHGVFVHVRSGAAGGYDAYVYALPSGRRLAHAEMTIGDGDDPEAKFVELAETLYGEVFRVDLSAPRKPKQTRHTDSGPAFYQKWWFWTGVGVVAAAVAVPLLLPEDTGDGGSNSCPGGHVCGDVVFSW